MIKRIIVYLIGVFILALGIVLNSKTALGVSPILSLPFTLSHIFNMTLGQFTTIIYVIFIIIQIILVRRIDIKILLQIPFSYIFGLIIDFYNLFIKINNPPILLGIILLLLAILCTAVGVILMLQMELIVNPADGMNNTIASVLNVTYGKVKLISDIIIVCISIILGLLFKHTLIGIGVGTIVATLLTGPTINFINKYISKYLVKIRLNKNA